jgi:hypothetical protein
MKRALGIGALVLASCGCVTAPLEHYTVNQSLSVSDMRYQEVMNALAMVAHNPGTLPSYSLTAAGVSNVTHSVSLSSATAWTRVPPNFGSEIFGIMGSHTPDLSLGIDPVAEPMLLAGAWYACRWAIRGPPPKPEYDREYNLLRMPVPTDIVGCQPADPTGSQQKFHLGVIDDQHPIPTGWLCFGDHCPPHGTCYQAHCGDTYVWVMPEGLHDLSEFTLVLLDIATIDPTWLAQQKLQATVAVELTLPGAKDPKSIITETWSACQMEVGPKGATKTKIIVRPFADPPPLGPNPPTPVDKLTLDLYGSATLAQAHDTARTTRALNSGPANRAVREAEDSLHQTQQMLEQAPPQADTPLPPPPLGAAPTVHTP